MEPQRNWKKPVRTLYLVDRIVLSDRRIACRKGLIFVTSEEGHPWYAVIYDQQPHALEAFERGVPIPFGATTPEGLWLEGIIELGSDDAETGVQYLQGLGRLQVSGESARQLPDAASWHQTTRRVS
jgi:hypothetical protein